MLAAKKQREKRESRERKVWRERERERCSFVDVVVGLETISLTQTSPGFGIPISSPAC